MLRRTFLSIAGLPLLPSATLAARDPRHVRIASHRWPASHRSPTLDTVATDLDVTAYMMLFEGLTELDAAQRARPRLATEWTIEPNGRAYAFRLREDAQWHSGEALTAGHAAAALNAVVNGDRATMWSGYLPQGTRFDAPDPTTLRVTLPTAHWEVPEVLASYPYRISPAGLDADRGNPYLGNGPYRVEHWDSRIGYVLWNRADTHWQQSQLLAETLETSSIEHQRLRGAVETGQADVAGPLLDSTIERQISQQGNQSLKWSLVHTPMSRGPYLTWRRGALPLTMAKHVKKAGSDPDLALRHVIGATPARNSALGPGYTPACSVSQAPWTPPAKTKGALRIAYSAHQADHQAFATACALALEERGVSCNLQLLDPAALRATEQEANTVVIKARAQHPTALIALTYLFHSRSPFNVGDYADETTDTWIGNAWATRSRAARTSILCAIEERVRQRSRTAMPMHTGTDLLIARNLQLHDHPTADGLAGGAIPTRLKTTP